MWRGSNKKWGLDVRFGSLADMASAFPNVRFTPDSGIGMLIGMISITYQEFAANNCVLGTRLGTVLRPSDFARSDIGRSSQIS
jgi:hypothetical protein